MRLIEYLAGFDRRLVFPWMSSVCLRLTGYRLYEVYESPEKQLEAAKTMDDCFQADFVYPLDDGVILGETLGMPLVKPDYDFPSSSGILIKDLQTLKSLTVPDPNQDGRMPVNLASFRLIADRFDKPLAISVQGPFTLACELTGVNNFIRAIIREPDFVRAVLDFTTQVVAKYSQVAVKAGVRLLCVSEPTAILLSPAKFEELVSINLKKIFTSLDPDAWKVLHVCGDTTNHIQAMLHAGAEGLSLDQVVNLKEIAPHIPKDVVIIGNIDPIDVLADSPAEIVRADTIRLLKEMRDYPNYMVSFGCDCLPDTPIENLKAAIAAGRTPKKSLMD